jgi:hypothetical protein
MSDVTEFDNEARRLTHELRASAARVPLRVPTPDFGASIDEGGDRHFALELFVAGIIAVVVVTLILALPRPKPAAPTPARPNAPVISPTVTPSPSPTSGIQSTISATGPLALYWTSSAADGSVTLTARGYSGDPAGVLVLPPSSSGFAIAPNGTRVLNGDQIIAVSGMVLGTLPAQYFLAPVPPIWADDSAHLCEISTRVGGAAAGTFVEFDEAGHARTVATLTQPATTSASWQVLSCSPSANRAVVAYAGGQSATIIVVQLSSGRVIAQHSVAGGLSSMPIASHGGSVVVLNEPSGVTIRNPITWALLGHVVRWGSQEGYPLIGTALNISWDGSRIIVDGGGAGGGFHPEWMVDWATDRTLLTNTGTGREAIGVTGFDDAIPLTTGTGFFLSPGSVSADLGAAYLLEANGDLKKLAG